jgi:hypothetical protein
MIVIAIGGNATTATSVRVQATQGAATVNLLDIAIAGLTRSTVNRPGAANNTVLADGASFVANDANTAIRAVNNGAAMTVATAFDFIIQYAVDQ